MRGIVGVGSRKALQESITGRYVRAPDGESHNEFPVWICVSGTRFLYRVNGGRWKSTYDRAHFARNVGIGILSVSVGALTPVDVTGWSINNGTDHKIFSGVCVTAMTSSYFPLR